ncbi:MAG: hypothetical protein JJU11_08800 [Candidatus Sumerlaeia bacterium]|nr:hypothetical protein [Candidatus Sumerlaeia bacterium]
MKFRSEGISLLIRFGIAAGLLTWGAVVLWSQAKWETWISQFNEAEDVTSFFEELDTVPGRSAAYRTVAFSSVNSIFPRQWDATLQATESWIELRPFAPEPWVYRGQALFMTGNREQGLAALEFSARVAPGFPASRLQALPVWVMAGERDKAISLARDVAALDHQASMEAAAVLQASGFPSHEVWSHSLGNNLPPREAARLLRTIHRSTPDAQVRVYSAFSDEILDDPKFRELIVTEITTPPASNALRDLWQRHHENKVVYISLNNGSFLLSSPSQPHMPGEGFYLGWQNPPGGIARSLTVRSSEIGERWRIAYRESNNQRHWVVHRGVIMEKSGPFEVSLLIQAIGSGSQPFRLVLITPGGEFSGPWKSPDSRGTFQLTATVPLPVEAGILEVRLQNRGTTPFQPTPEFDVISLRIDDPAPEEATDEDP